MNAGAPEEPRVPGPGIARGGPPFAPPQRPRDVRGSIGPPHRTAVLLSLARDLMPSCSGVRGWRAQGMACLAS